jgi:protein TonB
VKVLPEAVTVPQVAYPPAARRQQVEGTVTLEVTVGRDGKVLQVKVVRGIGYGLDEAAIRALKSATFKPAVGSDGRAMIYTLRYRYTFRIER